MLFSGEGSQKQSGSSQRGVYFDSRWDFVLRIREKSKLLKKLTFNVHASCTIWKKVLGVVLPDCIRELQPPGFRKKGGKGKKEIKEKKEITEGKKIRGKEKV